MIDKLIKHLVIAPFLTCAFVFQFSLTSSIYAQVNQSQTVQQNTEDLVNILSKLLSKDPIDFRTLEVSLPKKWLTLNENLNTEKVALEKQLEQQNKTLDTQEKNLLNLKLQYLSLTSEQRNDLIKEAQTESVILKAQENAEKQGVLAKEVLGLSQHQQTQLTKKIKSSENLIEKTIFNQQKHLEEAFEKISESKKQIANAQNKQALFLDQLRQDRDRYIAQIEPLETKNNPPKEIIQQWINTINVVTDALNQSNKNVKSFKLFEKEYVDPANLKFNLSLELDKNLIKKAKETNQEHLIQDYKKRKLEYDQQLSDHQLEKNNFLKQNIAYEKTLRNFLIDYRYQLLKTNTNKWRKLFIKADRSPFKSFYVELNTFISNLFFSTWSNLYRDQNQTLDSNASLSEKAWYWTKLLYRWLEVILTLFIGFLAIYYKKFFISLIKNWNKTHIHKNNTTKTIKWLIQLIDNFYIFVVLAFFSFFCIKMAVVSGFHQAEFIKPYIKLFLIYFLARGFFEALVPLISQRKYKSYGKEFEDAYAIESTFRLVPFYVLRFWIVVKTIKTLLIQSLTASTLVYYIDQFWIYLLIPILLFGVWKHREDWRKTCQTVSEKPQWKKIFNASKNKLWEPLFLLFGAGIGVYLIAWRRIILRLIDTRITRSFQAMVSRAILERSKKIKSEGINYEDLPKGYSSAFGKLSLWKPEWHVSNAHYSDKILNIYNEWQANQDGKTVLIKGERGIGKIALINHFLNENNINFKKFNLPYNSFNIEKLHTGFSENLFEKNYTLESQITKHLNELPPSIFVIDHLENAVLRKVHGFEAYFSLLNIILKAKKHLWLCSINVHTWGFLQHAAEGLNCFSNSIDLKGLDEREIENLILKRHHDFGIPLNFSNLSFNEKKDSWNFSNYSNSTSKEKDLYFRMLWDYTSGNPREAMYFWATSLTQKNDQLQVNLFDIPESNVLEKFSEDALMLLTAIIEHNGLSLSNLSLILRSDEFTIQRTLESIEAHGILYSSEYSETLHIDPFWYRAVSNYLVRRNMLFKGSDHA